MQLSIQAEMIDVVFFCLLDKACSYFCCLECKSVECSTGVSKEVHLDSSKVLFKAYSSFGRASTHLSFSQLILICFCGLVSDLIKVICNKLAALFKLIFNNK